MRDLQKDLELCNAATPGPWEVVRDWFAGPIWWVKGPTGFIIGCTNDEQLARCIAESREGWPEAIQRAMAAEARVKRLESAIRETLDALRDHDHETEHGLYPWNEDETLCVVYDGRLCSVLSDLEDVLTAGKDDEEHA